MNRFYVDANFEFCPVLRDRDEIDHIRKVLRYRKGDKVEIFDAKKKEYLAVIKEINRDEILFEIETVKQKRKENSLRSTLYQGIAKGTRMEFVMQKSTELGMDEIVPVRFERCVAKLDANDKKIDRWNKICLEAAKQSKRNSLCIVREAIDFVEMVEELKKYSLVLFLYEEETTLSLKKFLQEWRAREEKSVQRPLDIALIVGPEGGIGEDEARILSREGFRSVTLGDNILRTETVGATAMAMLQYEFSL
ncbi:RsmE family RNA methyltransferase [Filifactor villosus]|uniref:Ribosomal RNA small subunit methyltransferase E n=1 Tax=Filifactor villosus TaxID=29374 RepID=A0ABV9QMC3_9FIRM